MALLFMDSFDHYATADILKKWAVTTGSIAIQPGGGRHGSSSMRFTTAGFTATFASVSPPNLSGSTIIMGMAFNSSFIPTSGIIVPIAIKDGVGIQLSVSYGSDGRLKVTRGSSGGAVLLTSSLSLLGGIFTYVELKTTISTTVGTIDMRFNGVSVGSVSGINTSGTGNTSITGINIGNGETGASSSLPIIDIDDFYVSDTNGASPWNNFLGDVRVDARLPTAAGATTGWTPSTGANWQNVDDAAPNGDTDYNSTLTTVTDTFVTQDAPVVGASILGVQVNINATKLDAGVASVASVIRHSGVDNVGSNLNPATAYSNLIAVHQVNPGTGVAWTEAGFNAAEFGYKRTA